MRRMEAKAPKTPRQPLASPLERIKMPRAVQITGESARTLQAAAARGDIPGALKPIKCWTFDEAKLRGWLKAKEKNPCLDARESEDRKTKQTTRSSGARRGGRALPSQGKSSEEVYTRAKQRLLDFVRANGENVR